MGQKVLGTAFPVVLFLLWAWIYEMAPGLRGLLIIITIGGVSLVSHKHGGL